MAPLVRRSWSLQGQPSVLKQKTAQREKVSVAGALWLSPSWDYLGLAYQTLVNAYYTNETVATFLQAALQALPGPIIVLWDGGKMHQGDPIRQTVASAAGRLRLERLPPYTPELMPVEQVWTWLKYNRLCNYAAPNAQALNRAVTRELERLRADQKRLRGLFHASKVPLPRTLLS